MFKKMDIYCRSHKINDMKVKYYYSILKRLAEINTIFSGGIFKAILNKYYLFNFV